MPEAIGTLLNARYLLEAEIGRGGMGAVYRARLLREARAAAVLNDPNILTVHDVGERKISWNSGKLSSMRPRSQRLSKAWQRS